MTRIFHCERWIPCQASTSVLCLHYHPVTAHCSTKVAYTSEMSFLALNPCTDASILVYKFRPERTGFKMYAVYATAINFSCIITLHCIVYCVVSCGHNIS